VTSPVTVSRLTVDSPIGHHAVSGLVYLSARPPLMKRGTLDNALTLVGVNPQAILCGSIMTSFTNVSMARKKVENFTLYHFLFPEHRVVWLGDSGQGDILVGLELLALHDKWVADMTAHFNGRATAADDIDAVVLPPRPLVLIHDLRHSNQTPYNNEAQRVAYAAKGVYLFDLYLEAAAIAFKHGLLSPAGLRYVTRATEAEFARADSGGVGGGWRWGSIRQQQARHDEYRRAMAHAAELLAGM